MAAGRDRRADGRPVNARPRDALGRPLARGSVGVPAEDDPQAEEPSAAMAEVVALLAAHRAFRAHEVCEAQWKAADRADTRERAFWKGMAQICVGVTHLERDNPTGARAVIDRGCEQLLIAGDRHGLSLAPLIADAKASAYGSRAALERLLSSWHPPTV